jgi:hypothetical protein
MLQKTLISCGYICVCVCGVEGVRSLCSNKKRHIVWILPTTCSGRHACLLACMIKPLLVPTWQKQGLQKHSIGKDIILSHEVLVAFPCLPRTHPFRHLVKGLGSCMRPQHRAIHPNDDNMKHSRAILALAWQSYFLHMPVYLQ